MLLGYNTNGLAHHDPFAAIELLADLGYQSVAITLDHGRLNPFAEGFDAELLRLKELLRRRNMRSVIETGARYLLDPRTKHEPTLMSVAVEGRERRLDFLRRSLHAAAVLESDCLSCWSGVLREAISEEAAFERLIAGLQPLLADAAKCGIPIGFEPEPGMFIDTMARFEQLTQRIDSPWFKLTLDVGHLHCQREEPIPEYILRWHPWIVNVHLEDMKAGVHDHLMFGRGEMDFFDILAALTAIDYRGGVHVELSRHSHVGPQAAAESFEFLEPLVKALQKVQR